MNYYRMTATTFDRDKNIKALTYTIGICLLLFIIFFYVKWTLPQVTPPPVMEFVEVNLGNSDEGLGDVAPQLPGEPAAASDEHYTPPSAAQPAPQQQNITGDENETEDVPAVDNAVKPVTKPNNVTTPVVTKPKPVTQPVVNPTPAPPKPKAVYKGGTATGTGGNNADSYNGVRNQGIAGGNGDQGSPNGNPNSDSYKGNGGSGSSGVRISRGLGGRKIQRFPSFEDDFNENAKVAVDIKVDATGKVLSAVVNPRNTTTTNVTIRGIAIRKALQLKLNTSEEDEQVGTILFEFRLKG